MTDPADDVPTAPGGLEARRRWFEPASAVLMALATLGSAWCSYQSSQWSGLSSEHASEAARLQHKATGLHLEGNQVKALHLEVFMELMDARLGGNENLTRFYTERFTPEMKTAYEGWLAQNPFENPKADPHPFVPHLYTLAFADKARAAMAEEVRHSTESKQAGNYSARYLSHTVLLATTLFFAGTARSFDRRAVRHAILFFAMAIFVFCLVRVIPLPIA